MAAAGAHPATAGRSAGRPGRHAGLHHQAAPAACAAAAAGSTPGRASVHPEGASTAKCRRPSPVIAAPVGTHAPSLATPPILSAGWPRRCPRDDEATAAARNADGRGRGRVAVSGETGRGQQRSTGSARRRAGVRPARTPPPAGNVKAPESSRADPGLVGARTWSRRCRPAARSRPGSRSGRRPAATGGADGGSVRSMRTSTPRRRTRSATCRGPWEPRAAAPRRPAHRPGQPHRTSSGGVAGSRPLLVSTRRASPGAAWP